MLDKSTWKPDYVSILKWRNVEHERLLIRKDYRAETTAFYRNNALAFITDWGMTYEPRNAGDPTKMTSLPFALFPKQVELVEALIEAINKDANLLVEKSRDMGATWVCIWVNIWLLLFHDGADTGWGSRKGEFVDKLGVMSSIFEKIRWALRSLPKPLLPQGFGESCMSSNKIINPVNGTSIIGECGDDVGRGGRTRVYFKDESAHYEHPEMIEASLGDNTRVQIDISSVHGLGNVFYRKRKNAVEWRSGMRMERGKQYCFIMDWRDHPLKDQAWYDQRRRDAEQMGLLHLLAQEVDRDYSSSVVGTIIPALWVQSAIDAHLKLPYGHRMLEGRWVAGMDVADSGNDRNALAMRQGVVLRSVEEWGAPDTGVTTRRAVAMVEPYAPLTVWYDCIGVGAGVKAEANRLQDEGYLADGVQFMPWDAGSSPLNPDDHVGRDAQGFQDTATPLNKDFYGNLKAQGWWELRRRFEKTHRAVTQGVYFNPDEMVSLDSTIPRLRSLQEELSQPTQKAPSGRMKLIVDKVPEGTRSPNMADAVMECYWPADADFYDTSHNWVG